MTDVILCPFWRESRARFGVKLVNDLPLCDNLLNGVPDCVAGHFYPDDPYAYASVEDYMTHVSPVKGVKGCSHFVRSDIYGYVMPPFPKKPLQCLFGGEQCLHPNVRGFGACSGCSRFGSEKLK